MKTEPDDLERLLMRPGPRDAGGALPPLPPTVQEARTMLHDAHRSSLLRSLIGAGAMAGMAVAAVVVLAILLRPPSSPTAATQPPVVGSATPSPTAVPSELSGLPLCAPGELKADSDVWGAAAGSRGTSVTLTNVGGRACALHGAPGAQLTDASGGIVIEARNPAGGVAPWSNPGDPTIRMDPGKSATTSVVWSNWCAPAPSMPMSVTLRLVTGLLAVQPDASNPDVIVPPCMGTDPSSLSTIAFSPS